MSETDPGPDRTDAGVCRLSHRLFHACGEPLFRRAEPDGAPVMQVRLGQNLVQLPLSSLSEEFGIDPDSADGRMVARIAQALAFVTALRPGDALPTEAAPAPAPPPPSAEHRAAAFGRLHAQLLDWADLAAEGEAADVLAALEGDGRDAAALRLAAALDAAARALRLPGRKGVLALMDALVGDLAHIEALRERLLRPAERIAAQLRAMAARRDGDLKGQETLTEVRRLSELGLARIRAPFDELDTEIGAGIAALRRAGALQDDIREKAAWLYATHRAWEPVLADWSAPGATQPDRARGLLDRTYAFLAPRYMPVTEWTMRLTGRYRKEWTAAMVW